MISEREVLFINMWESRCGNCGKSTLPHNDTHEEISGYGGGGKGCGVTWTHVSSDYGPRLKDAALSVRPDLTWVEWDQIER